MSAVGFVSGDERASRAEGSACLGDIYMIGRDDSVGQLAMNERVCARGAPGGVGNAVGEGGNKTPGDPETK